MDDLKEPARFAGDLRSLAANLQTCLAELVPSGAVSVPACNPLWRARGDRIRETIEELKSRQTVQQHT